MSFITPAGHGTGYVQDDPDERDLIYDAVGDAASGNTQVGAVHPLLIPSIWDQLTIGSCTAHGSLRAFCVFLAKLGVSLPPSPANGAAFSRLEQYYNSRALEGTTSSDSGAQVRDAFKALQGSGVAPETAWLYDVNKLTVNPGSKVEVGGRTNMVSTYHRVVVGGPGTPMRTAINNDKIIVIGFQVPDYFENAQVWNPASGQPLPIPGPGANYIGGHCVALRAFDFSAKQWPAYFTADNSWGPTWGMNGSFNMSSEWFDPSKNLVSDLWVIDSAK